MVSINIKTIRRTHEGAKANNISDIETLRRSVMGCLLWEKTFYENGVSIAERIEKLVKDINDNNAIKDIAIEAKHQMKLRHVPLYIAVLLAEKRENVRKLIPQVVNRVDDMAELISLYWRNGKNPLSRSLIRGIADCFNKFDEYQFSKYKGAANDAIKLVDVVNLTHPKGDYEKIIKGTLQTPDTWEVGYSQCKNDSEKRQVWESLVSNNKLGGLATLRNIRNMEKCGFNDIKKAIKNINCKRLLPINFIKAAQENPKYEHLLENKFFETFEVNNFEKIKGKTIILIDVSGSMLGTNEQRVGGLAMIAREMFDDVRFILFGCRTYDIPARRGFALRDLCRNRGEGTYLGSAVKEMNQIVDLDRLIVLTDEQSHDTVPNPKAKKSYMVNVDVYNNGVGYSGGWVHINGWSDSILKYITEYEK